MLETETEKVGLTMDRVAFKGSSLACNCFGW